jgi:hypothetical protein
LVWRCRLPAADRDRRERRSIGEREVTGERLEREPAKVVDGAVATPQDADISRGQQRGGRRVVAVVRDDPLRLHDRRVGLRRRLGEGVQDRVRRRACTTRQTDDVVIPGERRHRP